MSRKANYYKIGLFVIIGVVIIIIGVIMFGAGKFFREKFTIETYFNQSIQGLDVGAPLKLRGVEIGNVKQIAFVFNQYPTDYEYVIVRADVYPDLLGVKRTPEEREANLKKLIEKGLRLELSSQGVTGVAFLNAVFLKPKRYPPLKIDWEPDFYYIPSAPGTITLVTQAIENLTETLESIKFKEITDDINTLINTLTKTVEDAQVATISKEILQVLTDLREPLETLDKVATNLDSIVDKEVRASVKDLSQILENAKTSTKDLPETIAELNKTIKRIRTFTSGQEQDIGIILENIRLISEDLKVFLDTAKRYPSWTLFGNPPDEVKK